MQSIPLISRLFKGESRKEQAFITVVSGLPRSGTSMMMKALAAGGIPVLTDHERAADESNPNGYFEFERVKQLRQGDSDWLAGAQGKAVKIISALLEHLPPDYHYKVIFMRRNMEEILASQRQMLLRKGENPDTASDEQMAALFQDHLNRVENFLARHPQIETLQINYNELVHEPEPHFEQIRRFLGLPVDIRRMLPVVDPALYRERQLRSGHP